MYFWSKYGCIVVQFAETYCEEEIGDLSHEDIDGYLRPSGERMKQLVAQFEQQQKKMFVD